MPKVIQSRLTFIRKTITGKHAKAIYKCICGVEKEISIYPVQKGIVISCGCYHKELHTKHGLLKHPLYSIWYHVKERCYSINAKKYPDYGARGVRMCDEWLNDFKSFYDWSIANGWKKGLQLDKDIKAMAIGIEPMLYSPEFCQFVTCIENNNAKRNNRFIEYNGRRETLTNWGKEYNISLRTLDRRLGGSTKINDASIFKPARHKAKNK